MLYILLLLAGFAALIFGAGKMVEGASALAVRFSIPNMVIGLTVVAFGTSSPELVVNVMASTAGNTDIVAGNVLGSNIMNILLILGLAAIIRPLGVKTETTWYQIPLCLLSAVAIIVMAADTPISGGAVNVVDRSDGLLLLLFFAIFLVYNFNLALKGQGESDLEVKPMSLPASIGWLIAGMVLLSAGGRMIVVSAVHLATLAGLSERVIALTVISIGTSLPELATSIIAARKGNTDIAIGNVVGSNIFNVFLIFGLSAVIFPVGISQGSLIDMAFNIFVSLLLFVFIFTGKGRRIERFEGLLFVLMSIAYVVYLLVG